MRTDWRNFDDTVHKTCSIRTHCLSELKCFCQSGVSRTSENVLTVSKHIFWNELIMLFWLSIQLFFFSFSCLFHWKRISWTEAKCNRTSVCKLVQSFSKHWKNRSYKLILTDVFYSYLLSYVFFPQRGEKNALSCAIEKAISESIEKFVAALVQK